VEKGKEIPKNVFYRHFDLPTNFPVIGLLGESWMSGYAPVTRQHFHNCMEIGYLYQGSGELYLGEMRIPFKAPCLVLTSPNVPHFHSVNEGEINGWKWIYVDPMALLSHLNPRLTGKISDYQRGLNGEFCVLSAEKYPHIYETMGTIIHELEEPGAHYTHVVRSFSARCS